MTTLSDKIAEVENLIEATQDVNSFVYNFERQKDCDCCSSNAGNLSMIGDLTDAPTLIESMLSVVKAAQEYAYHPGGLDPNNFSKMVSALEKFAGNEGGGE